MTIMKNIVALTALFFQAPCLYLGLTVPSFQATPYLIAAMFCAGVYYLSSKDLSNTNKVWLVVTGLLWLVLMVAANSA